MQRLASAFVPAADEVHALQTGNDEISRHFQAIAEQGHYSGRTQPTNTRQGIYATAPSGTLLSSVNTRDPRRVAEMLTEAIEAWDELSADERALPGELAAHVEGPGRWVQKYPTDGLVLRVHSRDLPREQLVDDWRADAWNTDFAWFTAAEAGEFVPANRVTGESAAVPPALVKRLVCLHLVDNVRGQVQLFDWEDVDRAALTSMVTDVRGDLVHLEIRGATRAVKRGRWPVSGYRDRQNPGDRERGVETTLLGYATYNALSRRFVQFEMVAVGTRWGGTQYNGRGDDLAPGPIGFLFSLADGAERVPPAFIWRYGWD